MSGTWRSLGVVSGGARHPHYASLATRLASFERWPAERQQEPQSLAEAGFFHTGIDDQVILLKLHTQVKTRNKNFKNM